MKLIFETYAKYNARMNQEFYDLASQLDVNQLSENRGVYFSSIIATLNHIVVGDISWLKRFAQHPLHFTSLDFVRKLTQPPGLRSIVHDDLVQLRHLRESLDKCILAYTREVDAPALSTNLTYSNFRGVQSTKSLKLLMLHFFNHQTHHRGQVSALFSQMNIDIGVTDLLLEIPNI
ncbi:DinB family protein [Paraglaciecola arctica]|uniref:DinB family protein n=1 Tax=Paraglaciecola arctica TaxID=1128911 RepID=UPI001C073A3D|nr:DinB family protein [Paraglaciecola arctica]MBU3005624.1 DinB family protein [Paraglaciecola arctica]